MTLDRLAAVLLGLLGSQSLQPISHLPNRGRNALRMPGDSRNALLRISLRISRFGFEFEGYPSF